MNKSSLPDYESPPVIEVVCGIQFEDLTSLHGVHLGAFWEKLKPDYDHATEVPPLAPLIELFEKPSTVNFSFSAVPPMARTWLLTAKENGIVQVQRDRFLHNWKKVTPDDDYPRFERVIAMFRDRLAAFEQFLFENELGQIQPTQYEMTYVNHLPRGHGWDSLAELGKVFPDFVRDSRKDRFLPHPDQVNWRTSFLLPENQGRLHASLRHITPEQEKIPLLYFELTARGIPANKSRDAMWQWFDLAHEWIVLGFADLTSRDVRKSVWNEIKPSNRKSRGESHE